MKASFDGTPITIDRLLGSFTFETDKGHYQFYILKSSDGEDWLLYTNCNSTFSLEITNEYFFANFREMTIGSSLAVRTYIHQTPGKNELFYLIPLKNFPSKIEIEKKEVEKLFNCKLV